MVYPAWQAIRARVVKSMEAIRTARLNRERCERLLQRGALFSDVYKNWWTGQDNRSELPLWGEVLRHAEVISVIDQPNEVEVDEAAFEPLISRFPAWAKENRETRDDELRTIVLKSAEFKDKIPDGIEPLSLASVVFDCSDCRLCTLEDEMLPPLYPAILGHDCLNQFVDAYDVKDPLETALLCAAPTAWPNGLSGGFRWSCNSLSIGVLHQRAVEVIKACGMDPMTTTREEMDNLEARFWCQTCAKQYKGEWRQVMHWRDTVGTSSFRYPSLLKCALFKVSSPCGSRYSERTGRADRL